MKTTIEEINGKLCTVIRKPFDVEWARDEKATYRTPLLEHEQGYFMRYGSGGDEYEKRYCPYIVVILDALPKYPKPSDARLLYRYMAEGMQLEGKSGGWYADMVFNPAKLNGLDEITHAINSETGERVEVAINDQN